MTMAGNPSVLQEQRERTAGGAVSASTPVPEGENTETLLLSPKRLLDQAKGEKIYPSRP